MQVTDWSTIDFSTTLKASAPNIPLILSDSLLDPGYDYDFSSETDDGTEYYRGGKRYYRPYGWKRIALKVHGKYEDDTWLGTGAVNSHVKLLLAVLTGSSARFILQTLLNIVLLISRLCMDMKQSVSLD